jgi:quercetin dioxygenase-like cupin family protein
VIVSQTSCKICGTPQVTAHHQNFPEMSPSGDSPQQALQALAVRLKANIDAVSDPVHRDSIRTAVADVDAFLKSNAAPEPELSEVIDVTSEPDKPETAPKLLAKSEALEIRRLTLSQGREIPTHRARGEVTVHCLKGRIAFTSGATTREVAAGQLIILAAGAPHSLVALKDSSVLVTKLLPLASQSLEAANRAASP